MSLEFAATIAERGLDVAFEIASGETVALLGENGAGKSSVLSVTAGLLRPDRGRVVLHGRRLLTEDGGGRRSTDVPPHQRQVALLAQDPLLFPHLSVRANVAFGPRSRGVGRRAADELARTLLDQVGVGELVDRKPDEVSGGQAQRVAIARALAVEPQLLLLDEPMAAVDLASTPGLRQTLQRVLADRTAVVVTHDVLDALLLADRVIVLDRGAIVEDGPTRDVLSRPRSAYAARLAGLNLLTGTWRGDHVALDDGTRVFAMVTGEPPAIGDQTVVSFSPRAVAVYTDRAGGSPRNSFPVVITELEPLGDLVRVRSDHLSADVTARSVSDLGLAPGLPVTFTVKATEMAAYALG